MSESSLYERLGGAFAIAAVVDQFSDELINNPIVGQTKHYAATKPGSTPLGLEEAHRELKISPAEFDEVAAELARTLDAFSVPEREKEEVLAAFAAHKDEVTEGSR